MCPVGLIGFCKGRMMSCPSLRPGTSAKFSANVFPVTVIQSPCSKSFSNMNFNTAGTPPTWCRSFIKYLPLGFRSAKKGVLSLILWKSSIVKSISAALAMAKKCSTALVEPPRMAINRKAFSKDFLVTISRGFKSFFSNSNKWRPTWWHS